MLRPQTRGGQVPGATSRFSSTAACRRRRPRLRHGVLSPCGLGSPTLSARSCGARLSRPLVASVGIVHPFHIRLRTTRVEGMQGVGSQQARAGWFFSSPLGERVRNPRRTTRPNEDDAGAEAALPCATRRSSRSVTPRLTGTFMCSPTPAMGSTFEVGTAARARSWRFVTRMPVRVCGIPLPTKHTALAAPASETPHVTARTFRREVWVDAPAVMKPSRQGSTRYVTEAAPRWGACSASLCRIISPPAASPPATE